MADLTKITGSDYENVGIHSKNNPLGLSVTEAKAAFDELSVNVIIPKINSNVDVTNNRFAVDESSITANYNTLNTKINGVQSEADTNTASIAAHSTSIAVNTANIQTNTNNIASNTAQINTNKTNIATNATNITTNTNNIIALSNNVLKKDNTIAYTPTFDYHPATRKFVTDSVQNAGGGDMLSSVYDKNQKRVDIFDYVAATFSNPNLLINSNFKNAVNQRGQSSYSGTGIYTIDRWKTIGDDSLTVAVNSDSITISNASADTAYLYQEIENGSKLQGENITTSVNVVSYSGTCAVGFFDGTDKRANITSTGVQSYTAQVDTSVSVLRYVFTLLSGASITMSWAKLELGSIATPFVPKPYGEELALCKRYYEKLLWRSFKRTYEYELFALVTFTDKRIGSPTVTCISMAETIGKVSGWNGTAYTDLDYITGFLTNNSVRIETAENTSMINYDFHIVIDAEL